MEIDLLQMAQKLRTMAVEPETVSDPTFVPVNQSNSKKRKYCYNQKRCTNWVFLSYGYKNDNEYYLSLIMLGYFKSQTYFYSCWLYRYEKTGRWAFKYRQ